MNSSGEHFIFKSQQGWYPKVSLRKKKKDGGSKLKIPLEGVSDDQTILSLKIHSDKFTFETDLVFFG